MKQAYLLIFCLSLLGTAAIAQPTLHQNNGFQIGSAIHLYVDISPTLNEGNGGANKTWNFSSLVSFDPITDFSAVATSTTPYMNDFPHAEVATVNLDFSGNQIYNYFSNEADHYSTWGYESAVQKLVCSNARDILRFPFTYGDSFSDTYYGVIPTGYNSGAVEVTADGYGTLILPTGMFYNCLRVREVRRDTLSDLNLTATNDTSFKFYAANYPEPLCQVSHHHSSDGFNFDEIYWQDVQPSGITDINTEIFSISPNPCRDILKIDFISGMDENMKVKITDALGREVTLSECFYSDGNSLTLNTSALAEGIYYLTIEARKNRTIKKFVRAGTL